MAQLLNIRLSGFKSIESLGPQGLDLKQINVLIGENGAGKSNLVSFFELLNYMITDGLRDFVGRSGAASSVLHYGPKTTSQLKAHLSFQATNGVTDYEVALAYASGDSLIFTDEIVRFKQVGHSNSKPFETSLGAGHAETKLNEVSNGTDPTGKTARVIRHFVQTTRVFHFHDTSPESKIKQSSYIGGGRHLKSDGGDLAGRLYVLKNSKPQYYQRILSTIRQIAPFFGDFILEPSPLNNKYVNLDWTERGSDVVFGAHQLSDGTIRFIALATLLLQPPDDLPDVIVVDEPELGLHPVAVSVLGAMVHSAAQHAQVIMTTQNPKLLDEFDPEDVVTVSRTKSNDHKRWTTVFNRLSSEELGEWLENYCLSDLWDRNVLGARPLS